MTRERERRPRAPPLGAEAVLRRCDEHLDSLRQAVLSPHRDGAVTPPYFAQATQGLASPGLEERAARLQGEKAQLSETLRRLRERQRREIDDLEATLSIREEGHAFLAKELERADRDLRAKQQAASARHESSGKLTELVEALYRKQSSLEDEVRRLATQGPASSSSMLPATPSLPYPAAAHDDLVTRSGIEWTRQSDELLRLRQQARRGGGGVGSDGFAGLHPGMSPGQLAAALRSLSPEAGVTPSGLGHPSRAAPSPARLLDRLKQPIPSQLSQKVQQHRRFLLGQLEGVGGVEAGGGGGGSVDGGGSGGDDDGDDLESQATRQPGDLGGQEGDLAMPAVVAETGEASPVDSPSHHGAGLGGGLLMQHHHHHHHHAGLARALGQYPESVGVGVGVGGGVSHPPPRFAPYSPVVGGGGGGGGAFSPAAVPGVLGQGGGGGGGAGGVHQQPAGNPCRAPTQTVQQMMRQAMVQARSTSPARPSPRRPSVSPSRPSNR